MPSLYDAQIETYSGRIAGTNRQLLHSLPSLTHIGSVINEHVDVLFNISENAAKVSTIKYKPRGDVELPSMRPDVSSLIGNEQGFDAMADLAILKDEMKQARQGFTRIAIQCSKARSIISTMYDESRQVSFGSHSRKLDKLEKNLEKQESEYLLAIKRFANTELSALRKPSGFDSMDKAGMHTWIRSYYDTLDKAAERFVQMIEALEPRIQLRMDESSTDTSVAQLLERWAQDKSAGRVLKWLTAAGENLDAQERSLAAAAAERFIESISITDTPLSRRLQNNNSDIDHCMRSLLFLFEQRSDADLQILSTRLDENQWPSCVLKDFTVGLCAELSEDHSQALVHYHAVIDACSERLASSSDGVVPLQRIIEESLVRMTQAFLALKDRASACSTLGTLCEMLPRYMVPYARLLNLCGNAEGAIELLQFYQARYPEDWRAGVLMAEIGEQSGGLLMRQAVGQ